MKIKKYLFLLLPILMLFAFSCGVFALGVSDDSQICFESVEMQTEQMQDIDDDTKCSVVCNEKPEEKIEKKVIEKENESKFVVSNGFISDKSDYDDSKENIQKTESEVPESVSKENEENNVIKAGTESTGTKAETDKENSSDYTVEFTHNDLQYVLKGNESVKLSKILEKVKIKGSNVEKVECSNKELFSASNKNGEWIVTSHKPFSSQEWMKVTVDGKTYNITVTDTTSGTCGRYMNWSLTGNTLYISGTRSDAMMDNATETVPLFAGLNRSAVKCVTIGDNVKNIGAYAFFNFPNLEVVSFPTATTVIASNAFGNIPTTAHICYWGSDASSASLTTACQGNLLYVFPSNLSSNNYHYLTNSIGYGSSDFVFYAFGSGNTTVYISGKGEMQNWSTSSQSPFSQQKSLLTKAVICGRNVDIGQYTFYNCLNLANTYIYGDTLNKVCANAFNGCTDMQQITLPDSVTAVAADAFWYCQNLRSLAWNDGDGIVRLPDSISTIGDEAFGRCDAFTNILIPSTITSIGNKSFARTSSSNANVYYWGEGASASALAQKCDGYAIATPTPQFTNSFKNSSDVVKYNFYYQTTEIGASNNWVYTVSTNDNKYCYVRKWPKGDNNTGIIKDFSQGDSSRAWINAQKVVFSEGITSTGGYSFYDCNQLTTVILSSTITKIEYSSFRESGSLANINLETSSVTTIERQAFQNDSALTSIILPESLTTINGSSSFAGCTNVTRLFIPGGVTGITVGSGATQTFELKSGADVYFANSGPSVTLEGICNGGISNSFVSSGNYTFHCKCGDNLWYTIKNNTATISKDIATGINMAMWDYDGTTTRSPFMLASSSIQTATISDATSIGEYAFWHCTSLKTLTLPNTVTLIDEYAFQGCSVLDTFSIPNSVTTIGRCAFDSCKGPSSLSISNNVVTIDYGAFNSCSGISEVIIYKDSTTLSSSLTIGRYAFEGLASGANIYYRNLESVKNNPEANLESKCYSDGTDANGRIYNSFGYTVNSTASGHYIFHFKCGNSAFYCINNNKVSFSDDGTSGAMWNYSKISGTQTPDTPFYKRSSEFTQADFTGCNVTTVGDLTFNSCSGLTSVTLSNNITGIDYASFEKSGITSIDLKNITTIGNYAFKNCIALTSVEITNKITAIGQQAFYCDGSASYTSTLSMVTIDPNANLSIGANAFANLASGADIYYNNTESAKSNPEGDLASKCSSSAIANSFGSNNGYVFHYKCGNTLWFAFTNSDTTVTISKGPDSSASVMWNYEYNGNNISPFQRKASTLTTALLIASDNITYIGNYAFYGCTSLTTFGPSNGYTSGRIIIPNTINNGGIGKGAFEKATSATTVTFQATTKIKSLPESAFAQCTSLTSVTLPNILESIGKNGFKGCTALPSIIIPSKVTFIGQDAFQGTSNGTKFYCKNAYNKTNLGTLCKNGSGTAQNIAYSFNNHANQEFYFPCGDDLWYTFSGTNDNTATISLYPSGGSTVMWNWAPNDANHPTPSPFTQMGANLTTVDLGPTTVVGSYAFSQCIGLTSVNIPTTVTTINQDAFSNISGLTSVTFASQSNLETLNRGVFYGTGITSITLPSSLRTIGLYAFASCTSLTEVEIPSVVTTIDGYAFNGNTALTRVIINPNANLFIGVNAFVNLASGADIYYNNTETVKSNPEGDLASKCSSGAIANSFGGNNNYLFHYKCGEHLWYSISGSVVTIVGDGAQSGLTMWDYSKSGSPSTPNTPFYKRKSEFTSINISNATTIGAYAFSECDGLTGLTIPTSVTTINQDAFSNISGLTSVTFASPSSLTTLNRGVFYGTGITSITLPSSLRTIGLYAFMNCYDLTNVVIPSGLPNSVIGQGAFKKPDDPSPNPLVMNVYYAGSQAAFEPLCTTSVTDCFDYGVGASNNLLYHFTQTITYYANSGTMPVPTTPVSYETNAGNTVVLPTPTRVNYQFDGWCTDSALQTTPITSFVANNTQFGDKTFYAKWTTSFHSIIYYCQYGSISSPTVTEYMPGSGVTLTLDKPARNGFAFCGWYSPSDVTLTNIDVAGGVAGEKLVDEYSGSGTLTFEVGTHNQDVYFYAKWYEREPVTYWENGQSKVLAASTEYEVIKPCETTLGAAGQSTWYVLTEDVDYDDFTRLTIRGNVSIILKDGCVLCSSGINVDSPNSIKIYAQQSDAVYNAPFNTSNVNQKEMVLHTNKYCLLNGKRYYYYNEIAQVGDADYFYNIETNRIYCYDDINERYSFNSTLSDADILAVPKSHSGNYTDDNDNVYTWNGSSYQRSTGEYVYYQQDASNSGYKYYICNGGDGVNPDPEDLIDCFIGYFVDGNSHAYYLDHDDTAELVNYSDGGNNAARTGDYVYSVAQPDKKYYYSSYSGGQYTFQYTDGSTTETLTLTIAHTDAYCYMDKDKKQYYPATYGEYNDLCYVDPTDSNPNTNHNYPALKMFQYPRCDIRQYFTNTLFERTIFPGYLSIYNPNSDAAAIGSSDINTSSGSITIYGGSIGITQSGTDAAAIGSSKKTGSSTVTTGNIIIYGGKIDLLDDLLSGNTSIGGGTAVTGGNIQILGGQITASHIGAGDNIPSGSDDTNLSISWTNKTDYIKLSDCAKTSAFSVNANNKFILFGELMIDEDSIINSKSDLPATGSAYLIPYYPINYIMTIPDRIVLPFKFAPGKIGVENSTNSVSFSPGEAPNTATYPYCLSLIITKTHFSKIIGEDNQGNSIYDNTETLEYSLNDTASGAPSVNKCFIVSNDNKHINYLNGYEATLGGDENMNIGVNDASKWDTLSPGVYGSIVTFTSGLSTVGCCNFLLADLSDPLD